MPRDLTTQPLFSPKLIASRFPAKELPPTHREAIEQWVGSLKSGLDKEKEESIRPAFLQRFFVDVLGYTLMGGPVWTLHHEKGAATGSADAALGTFTSEQRQVVAPFELKGPKTGNLDAMMPGRHKSPVQQAWEYANDLPGSQFVLVSNCVEIRLYALGYGRAAFESWQVFELLQPNRYASFVGLLSADNLLSNATQALLKDNAVQEREITQALYRDYKSLRQDLILGLHTQNPSVAFADLVRHAQKLIDRLLFIAFAESRTLLPQASIAKAASHMDPYNPQPRWANFVALFKAVDKGNPYLKIQPYNGGLFAPDAALEQLKVSDTLVQSFQKLAGYDYAQEVSVTVLGRIFEQSISDLEHIASIGDISSFAQTVQITSGSKKAVQGKRKRDGVVYTPDHITRFIVEQTLTPTLHARFDQLHNDYYSDSVLCRADKRLRPFIPPSVAAENIAEYGFWLAWQEVLSHFRACDVACGSGAFLVAAFDVFKEQYTQLHLKLRELAPQELLTFDISHQILTHNLFGVDINAESIEITKLSLWLKTAEQGRQLAGLDANFYQGNSLVEDVAVDALAFDWGQRYPAIFTTKSIAANAESISVTGNNDDQKIVQKDECNSGFDVIIGNPPYVRQELFGSLKPYLQTRYRSFHGVADLYVYFYELALSLLKDGGRLGFISSSSFFKTSSGEPLRRLLRDRCQLEVLVDFGDWQVFEGVTTYPAVVVAHKTVPDDTRMAHFLQLVAPVADLSAHFADNKQVLDLEQLDASLEWQLECGKASALRFKLMQYPSLKETIGSPYRGVTTGLNDAFVIDRATRDRLVFADVASEGLFKPLLRGDDIERWRLESQDLWLIFTERGIDLDKYPAVKAHLETFHTRLEPKPDGWQPTREQPEWQGRKGGRYKWFEIQDTVAYHAQFSKPKIIYPEISQGAKFSFDDQGYFSINKGFFISSEEIWLVGLLNSKAIWFVIQGICSPLRGGVWRYELRGQHIETLPIPPTSPAQQAELSALAIATSQTAKERLNAQRNVARRITDLLPTPPPKGAQTTLGDRLSQWWQLPDFKAFQTEVAKRFKTDIPLRDRNDWETLFTEEKNRIHQQSANIAATERSINAIVYALFGLTPAEIAVIEQSVR